MDIYNYFYNLENVNKILTSDKIKIALTNQEYNLMLIACDFFKNDNTIFVVLPNLYQAQKYYDSLASFINEDDILFFPSDELVSAEMVAATGDFLFERIQTIYTLLQGQKKIVILNMHAAIKYEMSPKVWKDNVFTLKVNDTINIDNLCHRLIKLGYESVYTIGKTGEFSKRGSIVDIFPFGYTNPIRLDFFGDDIEQIKEFNSETQRSISNIGSVNILPVSEFIYSAPDYQIAKNKILSFMDKYKLSQIEEDNFKQDLFKLSEHKDLNLLSRYLKFFENDVSTIFDFVKNPRIYFVDPIKSKEGFDQLILDLNEYCGRIGGYSIMNMDFFENVNNVINRANVLIEGLRTLGGVDINVYAKEIVPYKANQKLILDDFIKLKNKKLLLVCIKNEDRYKRLYDYFLENNIFLNKIDSILDAKPNTINIFKGDYPGFELLYDNFILINESQIFDNNYNPKRVKYKSIYKNAIKISKYDELCIGDYVVHYDYGIGKYLGIKTITTNNIKRDFLYVMYAKGSGLYIPLEQISSIMKYASKDVEGVVIHEIGSTTWARTKAKVRKRVRDISDKLIALYSQRLEAKGFKFPPDTIEQAQFESDFMYELTPDQKKAIDAVKRDMESDRPMDRLICGDVGYGKTEVAMRACFKAVYGGKQVCMLAPTTILARQHYVNFKERMENYGIRVELLSRFVSAKEQKKIIEDLKTGGVDVVIGTHRVLSDEVKFKDLGLLIVDEEQRFGVTHKEKIKELKVNVDCITLSATPIPRTLQMSVMGIKDLSMIETPPKNRYPIQTYVLQRNDRIIADAIERELSRGGQVFYLYNFVDSIEQQAAKLKSLVPDARICIGHGKLSKDKLEDVLVKFINKEYDILLCTTIIETGIDMPDTNTLIIHDADRLGLSQMYQIRGRVGRTNKIAYAYLMYEPRKVLTPEAEKRLETIKEFNELGSGFKIAMRDLSIRGAGDLLGEEQSGFVESVGLDMYMKILQEELHKVPIKKEEKVDASLTTPLSNRSIDKSYIDNDDIRISIHKKIDKLTSLASMNDLVKELEDRFGSVNDDLLEYMYEKVMKAYCKKLGIYKIKKINPQQMQFSMNKDYSSKVDGVRLFSIAMNYKNISLTYLNGEVNFLQQVISRKKIDCFKEICNFFDTLENKSLD